MASDLNIDQMIRDAMARGEFDNLKGKGKPLDLDAYFSTPENIRMAFSILKSNDFVPEEVEMMKEIAALKEELGATSDSLKRGDLARTLHKKQLALTIALERHSQRR